MYNILHIRKKCSNTYIRAIHKWETFYWNTHLGIAGETTHIMKGFCRWCSAVEVPHTGSPDPIIKFSRILLASWQHVGVKNGPRWGSLYPRNWQNVESLHSTTVHNNLNIYQHTTGLTFVLWSLLLANFKIALLLIFFHVKNGSHDNLFIKEWLRTHK